MNKDACRIRRDEAGETFAAIRHIALNLLNADKSVKAGLKRSEHGQVETIATYLESL